MLILVYPYSFVSEFAVLVERPWFQDHNGDNIPFTGDVQTDHYFCSFFFIRNRLYIRRATMLLPKLVVTVACQAARFQIPDSGRILNPSDFGFEISVCFDHDEPASGALVRFLTTY